MAQRREKSNLKFAQYYATKLHWPIIPVWPIRDGRCACEDDNCTSPGKHPIAKFNNVEFAPRGIMNATTRLATIKKWWSLVPDANIGARGTRFFVLDIDRSDALAELEDDYDRLPDTIEAVSGSGGTHLFFQQPKEKIGNQTGGLPKGIDVRGEFGYVLLHPSENANGPYEWEASSYPHMIPMAKAPDWLIELIGPKMIVPKIEFSDTDLPDLNKFHITNKTKSFIVNGPGPDDDRSERDMSVVIALCRAGLTDDQIRAVYNKYPIGTESKYSEPGSGDGYLSRTIGRARVYMKSNEQGKQAPPAPKEPAREKSAPEQLFTKALEEAYQRGWNDALTQKMSLIEKLWPSFYHLDGSVVGFYELGYKEMKIGDAEYPALVVPYKYNSEISNVDFSLYGYETPRMWQKSRPRIFLSDFDGKIRQSVIVTDDFDTAAHTFMHYAYDLGEMSIVALPSISSSIEDGHLDDLASKLADASRILLAWPAERQAAASKLASKLQAGQELLEISMPANLRDMYSKYGMTLQTLQRYIASAVPVIH